VPPAELRAPTTAAGGEGTAGVLPHRHRRRRRRGVAAGGLLAAIRRGCCCNPKQVELAFDAMTASVSMADIVTDVLVGVEFYVGGHMGFFYSSLAIFVVAQLSYAFMFAASYAPPTRWGAQCLVFAGVLPLAQLVPIFTWLETLQLPPLVRAMRRVGLRPSGPEHTAAAAAAAAADQDDLWSAIHRKYSAHAGFLLEAVVEAVPQGLLQTVFVVMYGELTLINALSLALSLAVLCSKGWIFSYSLHRLTFVFNSLCITSDVLGLFAAVCWLATPGARPAWDHAAAHWLFLASSTTADLGSETSTAAATELGLNASRTHGNWSVPAISGGLHVPSDAAPVVADPDALIVSLSRWWIGLAASGLFLSYSGGWCLLCFANFDDHLKLTQRREAARLRCELGARRRGGGNVDDGHWVGPQLAWWIYTYRTLGWVLACLPCSVVWLAAKLAWLPVCVFKSFDPEHASNAAFYRGLFELLRTGHLPALAPEILDPTASPVAAADPLQPPPPPPPPHSAVAGPAAGIAVTQPSADDVSTEATNQRLMAVNNFVLHARASKGELARRLASARRAGLASARRAAIDGGGGGENWGGRRHLARLSAAWDAGVAARVAPAEEAVVSAWAAMVGGERRQQDGASSSAREEEEEALDLEALLLIINSAGSVEQQQPAADAADDANAPTEREAAATARVRLRRALMAAAVAERRAAADASMLARSEVVRWLRRNPELPPAPVQHRWAWLRVCGAISLGLALIASLLWLPITLAFWCYSWLFPLLLLPSCFDDASPIQASHDGLACALSGLQLATVVAMTCLIPAVRGWQSLRLDLVSMAGFADAFYSRAILEELHRRMGWANGQQVPNLPSKAADNDGQTVSAPPLRAFDTNCSICLEPLLQQCAEMRDRTDLTAAGDHPTTANVAVALPLCLHAFHQECIYEWLKTHRSCPNCRQDVRAGRHAEARGHASRTDFV
jgi:hypothetical protein